MQGFRTGSVVAVAVLLGALLPTVWGGACGNDFVGKWQGRLQPVQLLPTPDPPIVDYYQQITYTELEIGTDTITQTYVGQDTNDRITCVYSCQDREFEHQGAVMVAIASGQLMSGSGSSNSNPFGCGVSRTQVSNQTLTFCNAQSKFTFQFTPLENPFGTWNWNIQYLPPLDGSSSAYMTCFSSDATPDNPAFLYKVQGYLRQMPAQYSSDGWYYKPGSIVIYVCSAFFATGWFMLFYTTWQKSEPYEEEPDEEEELQEGTNNNAEAQQNAEESGEESGSGSGEEDGEEEEDEEETEEDAETATEEGSQVSRPLIAGPPVHCSNCGVQVVDPNATFCADCGTPVVRAAAVVAAGGR